MNEIVLAFERIAHELAVALTDVIESLVEACGSLSIFLERVTEREAIERYGITEADIRSIDGTTVRLWNGRRIEVDS